MHNVILVNVAQVAITINGQHKVGDK